MAGVDYRYELRRGDEVVATGHLNHEERREVGDRIEIGGQQPLRTYETLYVTRLLQTHDNAREVLRGVFPGVSDE